MHHYILGSGQVISGSTDFVGPFPGESFLIVMDAHSKWADVVEMSSTTLSSLYITCLQLMVFLGSLYLTMDTGLLNLILRSSLGKHTQSSPYHHSSNGEAQGLS